MTAADPMNNGSDIAVAVEGTSSAVALEMIEPRKRAVETCKWRHSFNFPYLRVVGVCINIRVNTLSAECR